MRRLFAEVPQLASVVDEPMFSFDSPALVHAAGMKNRDLIDVLIDVGADIDARSAWGAGPYSALHRLVDGATPESIELAEHLLSRGASLDLHAAAGLGRLDAVAAILVDQPERVSEPGPDGATPLHLARNVEMAELLLSRGAEVDKRCVDHRSTPAQWAVGDRPDVARFLLKHGARPDLFMAAVLDDVDLAARLLESEPSAIDVRVSGGASNAHLGFGDKYTWSLDFAGTPLEIARRRANDAVYALLLERSSAAAQLLQAARRNDIAAIGRIVSENAEILSGLDADTARGILCGGSEATRLLLELGADPNVRDTDPGATPLHYAAWDNDRERIAVLLEAGADPGVRDRRYGGTPLGWANENDHHDLVRFFADLQPLDMLDACWVGRTERVREILEADPSQAVGADETESSPLRRAAWHGHLEIVRLLLEHGADPTVANEQTGMTALDHALEQGHDDVVKLLRE